MTTRSLKRELREEREYLNCIAGQLEAYLQLCYEEIEDYDLCLKFTQSPRIISMIRDQEKLKGLASKIYVYSEILRHRDTDIEFNLDTEVFTVKVKHYDYPF